MAKKYDSARNGRKFNDIVGIAAEELGWTCGSAKERGYLNYAGRRAVADFIGPDDERVEVRSIESGRGTMLHIPLAYLESARNDPSHRYIVILNNSPWCWNGVDEYLTAQMEKVPNFYVVIFQNKLQLIDEVKKFRQAKELA